jgi:hypothetical protein
MRHPEECTLSIDAADITRQFAAALDTEDYATARSLLANGCVYQIGDKTIVGVNDIIASYQKNSEEAPKRFDAIEYASVVESTGGNSAVIGFTDRVRLGDAWHEYHCRQHVVVDPDGSIVSIRHEEIPGEREQLQAFERHHRAETG